MSKADEFDFTGDQVASGYDDILVPHLFHPWAVRLVDEHGPWEGLRVLDLATGTGIVAQLLAHRIGEAGHIVASDINPDMLSLARQRCSDVGAAITVVESPAEPLDVESNSIDVAVCQQGFQFFPDQPAAAAEIRRTLRDGGRVIASCWQSTDQCEFFGAMCEALSSVGEKETAELMRRPFIQDGPTLRDSFAAAGFADVELYDEQLPMKFDDVPSAVEAAYGTPVVLKLRALTDGGVAFRSAFAQRLEALSDDGRTMGRMTSHMVTARKRR